MRELQEHLYKYDALAVYTDTDFAGCERARKSTSVGVI